MSKRFFVIIILSLLVLFNLNAKKKKKNKAEDKIEGIKIEIEEVSFDDENLLKIFDQDNNIIGYYENYETNTYAIILQLNSVKIYKSNKELIGILIPQLDGNRFVINIKNKNENTTQIYLVIASGGDNISGNFFDKNYEFLSKYYCSFDNERELYNSLYYEGKKVIFQELLYDSDGNKTKNTIIDNEYFDNNIEDLLIWINCFQIFNQMRGMQ